MLAARAKALYAGVRLAMRQGNCDSAEVHLQEAMLLYRELDDRRGLAIVLFSIGYIARMRGEYPVARRRYDESLQLFETLDDTFRLAQVHHELGAAAYFDGDVATAHKHYAESLDLYRRLSDDPGIVAAPNELADVALAQGELETARSHECSALKMARAIGDKARIAMSIAGLAGLAAARDQPTRALRLIGAATALNDVAGQQNSVAWHAMVERWLAPSGRAMPLDEAIEYALAFDDSATSAHVSDGSSSTRPPQHASQATPTASALTQREQEVAALVARGLTNRQIAAELMITEGTAASHVKHILARLTLDSPVQIATWAIEHGVLQSAIA